MRSLQFSKPPLEGLFSQCYRCHQHSIFKTPTTTTTSTSTTTNSCANRTRIYPSLTATRSAHHFRRKTTPTVKKYTLFKGFGKIPPYPYGPSQWFKQSNRALYGGARIGFGNNVSDKSEIRTRRRWHLNSQHKRLYSKVLDRVIRVRLTVKVMRTIEKVGGLDEYLLGNTAARIKGLGPRGWALRWRLMQEPSVKERIRRERIALGVESADDLGGVEGTEGVEGAKGELLKERAMERKRAKAAEALKRSPEDLARLDYEKIVRDKAGRLLGTEPSRWRLLHVLYMRRLKEQRENISLLEGGTAGEMEGDGGEVGTASVQGIGGGQEAFDAEDKSAVAEEVRRIDEALDAEDKLPVDDDDGKSSGVIDAENEKRKEKGSSSSARSERDATGGKGDEGDKSSKPWSEKRAAQSKGRLEVHPDMLEAAKRGEQPRSTL